MGSSESPPHYKKIASRFCVGTSLREYYGSVVVSLEAIYCVIKKSEFEVLGRSLGGLGSIAGEGLSQAVEPALVAHNNLPDAITSHPDWPLKETPSRVIVIPKNSVSDISARYWGSAFVVTFDGGSISISVNFLFWTSVKRYFKNTGWGDLFGTGAGASSTSYEAPALGMALGVILGIVAIKMGSVKSLNEVFLVGGTTVIGLVSGLLYSFVSQRK